jgi:hypothetical protein
VSEQILCAERLFDATLPEEWAPILDGLEQLYELKRDEVRSFEERCKLAAPIFERLLSDSRLLVEPTPHKHDVTSERFREWFSEAVLLWTRLAATGSPPVIDTIDTRTLDDFPLDLPLDDDAVTKVRAALIKSQGWETEAFARVERRIAHVTSNLDLKRAIAAVLADMVGGEAGPSPEQCVELMRSVYGRIPWQPGDVDLVITATTVFFCIRRKDGRLDEANWEERPASEREAISAFLLALKEGNVAETKRFPAFGMFDFAALDDTLVNELRKRLAERGRQVEREVIINTLATMVSVLRTQEVELYLVHDTWGHTWQEALSEFEWEYALLPKLDEPFAPDDGPALGGSDAPTLQAAFVATETTSELDEEALMRFAKSDLAARLQLGISAVVAEILADFMEAKYARLCPGSAMPTSSLIEVTTLKLDLTLSDMRRQVRRTRQRYRELADNSDARKALTAALADAGLPLTGLADAVERAAALMWERFGPVLDFGLAATPTGEGELKSTVYRRIVLKFLLLVAELERSLDSLGARSDPPWHDPGSCPDLMALSVSHFYERDRQRKFWDLDQMMRTELPMALVELRTALRGVS